LGRERAASLGCCRGERAAAGGKRTWTSSVAKAFFELAASFEDTRERALGQAVRHQGMAMAARTLALLAAIATADAFQSMGRLVTSSPQAYLDSLDALTPRGGTRLARPLRQLHPGTGSRSTGRLEVGSLPHSLYYEVHGSTDVTAPTALMLHGGPGAGCFSRHAQFFAPDKWRVVLFDQVSAVSACGVASPARPCLFLGGRLSAIRV
jgi:predicted transcriptional regulator